ncbi:MAG: B12-binding domain-containing radical SAM protein [Candidatus Hydrogenedens sp.]|nr:B12-binding domain-containing radical SAM protein [Candidatus Hydrogenedens sp.]
MRVVFVIPPFDFAWSVGNVFKKARNGVLPPLGVGFLAAALEANGHETLLVDAMAEQFNVAETAAAVAALRPDLVGVSIITFMNAPAAMATVAALRGALGATPIVLGGAHVTTRGLAVLNDFPGADYAIPGDGEIPLCGLVDALASGAPVSECPGLWLRDASGTPVATPDAPKLNDLDLFAPPARHLYKQDLYRPLPSLNLGSRVATAITARGCPWAKCAFCHQGSGCSPVFRRRSPEHVVDELEMLAREHGARSIVFFDDNFCVMPGWIRRFCDLLDGRGLRLKWSILARADTVTPEMLRRMADSGCYSVQFGFESGNQDILDLIHKGITLDQCRNAVRWARAAGLEIRGSFMLGFPTETPEMSEETIRFACELNADYMLFFAYHVLPDTALEEVALNHGRLCPSENFNVHLPSYVPDTYPDGEALAQMIRTAYSRYYLRPAYVLQLLRRTLRRPQLIYNHMVGLVFWAGLMAGGAGNSAASHVAPPVAPPAAPGK